MAKTLIAIFACALVGAGGAYFYLVAGRGSPEPSAAKVRSDQTGVCRKHRIDEARCPFCNPPLVASMGQCEEHGVPEALCYRCHPELEAAFKTEGDWCAEHSVPESQCKTCKGGEFPPGETPSSGAGNRANAQGSNPEAGGNP
jgi:cobalt-zinc-cadmium efflux system membrane fusion protein